MGAPPGAAGVRRAFEHALILLFFAAAAVAMTWPLAPNLSVAVAHPGDPFINSWILDWEFHALTHAGERVFHGNILHPLQYTIAFSENILGILAAVWPLLAAGLPVLVIYNLAVLAGYATAGYAMAILGRHVTGSAVAGVAAGVFFAFVPWRFTHLTHLQHLWTLWLPLIVLAMLRRRAGWFALAFFMNALTNLHWFAFSTLMVVVCAAAFGILIDRDARRRFAVAIAVCAIALLPVLWPYWKASQLYPLRGDAAETLEYSARPSGWLIASLHNRLYGPWTNDGTVNPEHWAFPGLLAIVLSVIGLVATFRRKEPKTGRVVGGAALGLIGIGFLGSLGLRTVFGKLLFAVPLFAGIRAPARWAMIAYLGMAILMALGTHALILRWRVVGWIVPLLLLLELRAAPIRWYLTTGHTPAVYEWLSTAQFDGGVLELPMQQDVVYRYLLFATVHHKPLINGVSGFKPPQYAAMERMSLEPVIPHALFEQFAERDGTILIVHERDLGPRATAVAEWLRTEIHDRRLRLLGRFGSDAVYVREGRGGGVVVPAHSEAIDGELLHPVHWEEVTGPLEVVVRGDSREGIARVLLHFDNRRTTFEIAGAASFRHTFARRPSSVRADTDLQLELIDRAGHRRRLPQVWLRWRNPGEALPQGPLPQTAELGPYVQHAGDGACAAAPRPPRAP